LGPVFATFGGINIWGHAAIVQTVGLREVAYVYFNESRLFVFDFEVKPLVMSGRV